MPAFQPVLAQLNRVILGKPDTVRLALTCLIAGGHLLLEDIPRVGKTTLAQALARGEAKMMTFLSTHGAVTAPFPAGQPDPFGNLNTPEDLTAAEAAL